MNFLDLSARVIKRTFKQFFNSDFGTYSASIAFYTIFSLPAVLLITLFVASRFYEQEFVRDELINQFSGLIGSQSAGEIDRILENAALDSSGVFAKVLGIGTLIFSATTVFMSLQLSLNKIWRIKPKPERGILKFLVNRVLSFAMVMSLGFLLLVSLVIDTVLVVFQSILQQWVADYQLYVLTILNILIAFGFVTLIFAMIFKVLPDAQIRWKDVWIGAIITAVLFSFGKYLIGFYLGNSSFNSAYGAAGSLVIVLVWVYYSTIIVLLGAEFTVAYVQEMGRNIRPRKDAVKIKVIEMEKPE